MSLTSFPTFPYHQELLLWRRHIHSHPELSWQELQTTQYIIDELAKMGIASIERPLKTGLVAIIENGVGKTIALRADIDALPIAEQNTCEYKSQNDGVMHACGHDVHTTCLLGAAKYLVENKDKWKGTIKLLFQPSEEKQPSGAEAMIRAGVLKSVESIIGLHVTPELEVGKLGFRAGPFMASADEIYMTVIGKGGHGASPHLCIDPIVLSAHIILALQNLVSRYADPKTPTVLTFGDIHGFGATNIIPEKVELKGTLRTFDEKWRKEIQQKIKDIATGIARSFGGDCLVNIPEGVPFVHNDAVLTEEISNVAEKLVGTENVVEMPIRMGAEDFSFYGHHCAASFFRLGTGNAEKGTTISVHNPKFDIDEDALVIGSSAMAEMAMELVK
ncbi:MAG: M20 family metallopeptidase [Chitinophagales bacterium]|jgi:amidohydrolase|nr:M20 family metallopeptidase [Sphingobacteriales bacterium]